jgi:predicted RNase H-like HicB family nuclease
MRAAIAFHVEGLQLAGQPIPEASEFTAVDVEVAA